MKNDLKPCPFCGGAAVLRAVPHIANKPFYVRCDNFSCAVNVSTYLADTPEEAMESWNKRVKE